MSKAIIALALAAALSIPALAFGQSSYRVIDLGLINQPAPRNLELVQPEVHMPYRINDKGHVVWYRQNASGQWRATLYLHNADATLGLGPGNHDLSELAELTAQSIALDINEADVIAGAIGGVGSEVPVTWTITGGSATATAIDFSGSGLDGSNGRAHGINDADPAMVTGFQGRAETECGLPPHPVLPKPFTAPLGGAASELPMGSGYFWGHGLSIADAGVIVGIGQMLCNPPAAAMRTSTRSAGSARVRRSCRRLSRCSAPSR